MGIFNRIKNLFKKDDDIEGKHSTLKASNEGYAVILGNEVNGVHQDVIDMCDGCLEIPQYGTKHSLNVSVTGGLIIWHFAQHYRRTVESIALPLRQQDLGGGKLQRQRRESARGGECQSGQTAQPPHRRGVQACPSAREPLALCRLHRQANRVRHPTASPQLHRPGLLT